MEYTSEEVCNKSAKLLFCGCILFDRGPNNSNTEGLRSALARLRHRTGHSLSNPSNSGSPQNTIISDTKSYHLKNEQGESPTSTPAPPSTPRKAKVTIKSHNAMTVAVTQSQVSVTSASSSSTNTSIAQINMGRPASPPGNSSSSDTDGPHHASSTALRRLYFKSTRSSRSAKGPSVPKVVVMGSSTTSTSEATINTSTESASTLVTNVTATDTSEACDSLDLGETSEQSEPLLSSLDEPPTTCSISSQIAINTIKDEPQNLFTLDNTPLSNAYKTNENASGCINEATPRTAPVTSTVHFPFDLPSSPKSVKSFEKNHSKFTFVADSTTSSTSSSSSSSSATSKASALTTQFNQYPHTYQHHQHPHQSHHHRQIHHHQPPISSQPSHSSNVTLYQQQQIQIDDLNKDDEKENKRRKDGRDNQSKCMSRENLNHLKQANDVNMGIIDFENSKKLKKDGSLKNRNRFLNSIRNLTGREKIGSNSKLNTAPAVAFRKSSTGYDSYDSYDSSTDSTMFPFDREAIDYKRIQQECFADEEKTKFPFNFDTDISTSYDTDSPEYEKPCFDSPSKSYKNLKFDQQHSTDSIFQQYSAIAKEESIQMYERTKKYYRNSHSKKYDYSTKTTLNDAFIPKTIETIEAKHDKYMVSKFDEIATKFSQIPPSKQMSDAYHESVIGNSSVTVQNSQNSCCSPNQLGGGDGIVHRTTPTAGPPLPNLRIDFFAEKQTTAASNKSNDLTLDECQKLAHAVTSTVAAGAINVTSNPMDTAVCTQPRATIVVQQASLSLDNTVETFLLKNENDFISVEQGKEISTKQKQKQREENMRQLLDVTNTLTSEEIRDFEMRYGSPHHSRSQSVKTPGSRASGRPNQLCLPQQRSRVASMPNTGVEEEYYRLRHFSITGKGIVNRGDSVKSKRSRSNNSVASSNSSNEHLTANAAATSAKTSATCSLASSRESSTSNPGNGPYRVLMLGGPAVGKSSLVSQFMTSEYLHAYDTSLDDDSGEKSISVLLSGEESELIFIDHSSAEMSPENCLSSYEPHGYCVIYSSADQESFMIAERVIQSLWTSENIAQRAVILVGNKADLARSRVISSEEGKAMATAYDCKFIETSVGINHNVDELLVGLLTQIRLKLENPEKTRDLFRKRSCRKSKRRACSPLGSACLSGNSGTNPSSPVSVGPQNLTSNELPTPPNSAQSSPRKYRGSRTSASLKVKGLLGRVWARDSKSKSCENLHVL